MPPAVQQSELPLEVAIARAAPALFAETPDQELLRLGVPPEWLGDVRQATEGTLLELADHLPAEAAEALLDLGTGSRPVLPSIAVPDVPPSPRERRLATAVGLPPPAC